MARTRLLVSIATLALAATAACNAPGSSSSSEESTEGPIKIAVVNAQSGQLSSLGQWEWKGAKLAADEWNAEGGINGRKIQLELFDDQGDPTVGTNLARKIASEGFVAMIGTAESAVTVAMIPVLQQAKIPNITSGQSPAIAATKSPFAFYNGPTSNTYDETLAKYLVDEAGAKTVALISNNGSFGKGEREAFTAALADRGITPVDDQVVTTDQKDFSAALTSIRQKAPDVLFIGTEEVEAGLIVKQARELGITSTIAGAAPMGTPVYLETAGAANAEGTVVSSPYLSNDTDDASREFAKAYQEAHGEEAEMHGAKAYDGANIVFTALKNSDGATGQDLADAIRGTKYKGLLGNFEFDETGVGIHATSIGIIKSGKLVAESAG
jgi:branched-chain amino acid transport system substrate-binding protein